MPEGIFVIVVSETMNNYWGEPTLLAADNNLAYSNCSIWTNDDNVTIRDCCFALVNRYWEETERNIKIEDIIRLADKNNQKVLLFWHSGDLETETINNLLQDLQPNMAHEPIPFHHDGNYSTLEEFMKSVAMFPLNAQQCHNKFNELVAFYLGKANIELLPELLPLDIDMQMLNDLSAAEAIDYLRRMIAGPSIYADNKNRFERLLKLKSKVTDPKVRNCLDDLIGKDENSSHLYTFLASLASVDALRSATGLGNDDVQSVVNCSASLKKENFHQWFCDMASCLKGRKMCS